MSWEQQAVRDGTKRSSQALYYYLCRIAGWRLAAINLNPTMVGNPDKDLALHENTQRQSQYASIQADMTISGPISKPTRREKTAGAPEGKESGHGAHIPMRDRWTTFVYIFDIHGVPDHLRASWPLSFAIKEWMDLKE